MLNVLSVVKMFMFLITESKHLNIVPENVKTILIKYTLKPTVKYVEKSLSTFLLEQIKLNIALENVIIDRK